MGWTTTNKKGNMSVKEFFEQEFNYSREDGSYGKVLECEVVDTTAYLAFERKHPNKETIEVSAIVCLLSVDNPGGYYNFGYKDISEGCGPCERECPAMILDMLTPTDSKYANNWRAECRANISRM